jgi:hypothetical protein
MVVSFQDEGVMSKKDKCIKETKEHIDQVRLLTKKLAYMVIERGEAHDASKLEEPELPFFTKYTDKLAGTTYGSDEYYEYLKELKPAIEHHYANNRHHPNHFPNGVSDMNLIDVIELLADWKSSSMRHNDGNILKSIELNAKRFGINEQLISILFNTAELLEL